MYEGEITKLQGSRMTIETQMMAIESATINIETFTSMRAGATAMKKIRGTMYVTIIIHRIQLFQYTMSFDSDADTVQDMMDEMEEEQQLHEEISNAISRSANDMFDDVGEVNLQFNV